MQKACHETRSGLAVAPGHVQHASGVAADTRANRKARRVTPEARDLKFAKGKSVVSGRRWGLRALGRPCARQLRGGRDDRSRGMQSSRRRPGSAEPGGAISQDRASTRSSFRGITGPRTRRSRRPGGRCGGRLRNWRFAGPVCPPGRDLHPSSHGHLRQEWRGCLCPTGVAP